jgi:hypothetical protein
MVVNDLPRGIPCWVMAVCAMPSSWTGGGESGRCLVQVDEVVLL